MKTVGTCSNCGGNVVVPTFYYSTHTPIPTCEKCGYTAKASGPVIPMEKPPSPPRLSKIEEMLKR
jgi:hypothetical protein